MRNFKLIILLLLTFTPLLVVGQQRNCGTMEHLEMMQQEYPQMMTNMAEIESRTQQFINNGEHLQHRNTITIPVVVHVVYKTNAQNISDAQIQSQIDVLNEDFRRMNADANGQWSQGADTNIEFCLATVDPSGNPTNGINRVSTTKKSFRTNDDVKKSSRGGADAWDTGSYLNMWVCNLSNSILGYAQFPGGNPSTDGVVMLYTAFGRTGNVGAPYDLGRTATHEVGHWLNLRHIWGDGGCSVDDFVSDTPVSDGANYGCATGHVSCGTVDMVENYMDYSNDACMNLFTEGQSARMNAIFSADALRASLLSSTACGTPPTPSCTDGIQNGNETGVDCGGDCAPCEFGPTCSDGIQNGNETGIDCGGDCDPCEAEPTCSDGIQNGNEIGIDCGGDCAPCDNGGGGCDTPSGLYASNIKPKRTTLNWDAVSGATSYLVQVDEAAQTNWNDFTTSNTSITISSISNRQSYDWRVQAICGADSSTPSGICNFTAGTGNSGDCAARLADNVLAVSPNPAKTNIMLSGLNTQEVVQVQIMNYAGQIVRRVNVNEIYNSISVQNLSEGMYLVKVTYADESISVSKFAVMK